MTRALVLLALLALAGPLSAAGWGDFYGTPARASTSLAAAAPQRELVAEGGICIREILKAQLRHGIPGNLLLGIGLQEAGVMRDGELTVWPWAVNAAGEGRTFEGREGALDWIAERRAAGIDSIDVGCMQINMRWHPEAFASTAQGFDPARNVEYAAQFLTDLHEQTGDWKSAAGSYHSFTPEKQEVYLEQLERNVAVANDRIEIFRTLAAGEGPGRQVARAEPAPRSGAIWSSDLGHGSGRRSIYSDRELLPVLPAFDRRPEGTS